MYTSISIVLLTDGTQWIVQGLQLDYTSVGTTQEEAITNFRKGLEALVKLTREKSGIYIPIPPPLEIIDDLTEQCAKWYFGSVECALEFSVKDSDED